MHPRLLEDLRQIREVDSGDAVGDTTTVLKLVAAVTGSARVTLRPSPQSDLEPIVVHGAPAATTATARFAVVAPETARVPASLVFERESAFTVDEAQAAELLGSTALLRIAQLHADEKAAHSKRQLELLRAVTVAGAEAMRFSEVAERVATALMGAFRGLHVLIHVVVDDHLELIARRLEQGGDGMGTAPAWARRIALEAPLMQSIAAREKRVVSKAVAELSERTRVHLEPLGVRRLVVAPLLSEQRVVGVLTVAYRTDEPWPAVEQRLVETASEQLGVAIAQLAVLDKERRLANDLALINELGRLIAQQHELHAVLDTAVHHLAKLADVQRVHLLLANDERTALVGKACNEPRLADMTIPLDSQAASVHAFRTKQPVVLDNAVTDPRGSPRLAQLLGVKSAVAVPLISRGESIGALILSTTVEPRHFSSGEVGRVVAVANLLAPAITNAKMFDDLRKSYDALALAQAELVEKERLAALGQFSAVIAHEVRNPLGVIYNSVGELRRITPATKDANEVLDIVAEEAERLNRIVVDLLDFVKPYSPHPRAGKLGELVQAAVDSAKRAMRGTSVQVHAEIDSPDDDLLIDGTMLQQAIINLVVNAIQASPKEGTVTVRAKLKDARLCCEILDDGPGIDPSNAKRIFEPFFTTKATGTGLGLAVVGRIVDALGGTIELARSMSGGAAFTLVIPVGVVAQSVTGTAAK